MSTSPTPPTTPPATPLTTSPTTGRRRRARRALALVALAAAPVLGSACTSAGGTTLTADPSTSSAGAGSGTGSTVGTAAPVGRGAPVAPDAVPADPSAPADRPDASRNAQVTRDGVTVHADPADTAPVVTTLARRTSLGSLTTLLVLEEHRGWLRVALPIRPNGATGWVAAADVEVRDNTVTVTVDLTARTLTVRRQGQVAAQTPVAIGTADTPTPTGDFFVTDLLENDDPSGAYGPFALGLSAHSDQLTDFAGGDGQIGIHGTNDPGSIGKAVSHGCVRVPNELIRLLATSLPLGTPVTIR